MRDAILERHPAILDAFLEKAVNGESEVSVALALQLIYPSRDIIAKRISMTRHALLFSRRLYLRGLYRLLVLRLSSRS